MNIIKLLSSLIFIIVLSGCTTMADSIAAKGTGIKKIYDKERAYMWPITVQAVEAVGLDLITSNESSNIILAQRGITAFSYGENVAIFIETINANQCEVEVVSKRAMQTNILAPDWSFAIFKYIDSKVQNSN